MKTEQLSCWQAIAAIIGRPAVDFITQGCALDQARMTMAIILEHGYSITTDGYRVYTDMPMTPRTARGWQALQPALMRVFDE
jgi:hypothetical protein